MNVALWICQIILSVLFAYSGITKSLKSKKELVELGQSAVEDLPLGLVRFIGIVEILGVIGIIFPYLTGIFPILTPLAAVGLGIIMILAAIVHYQRGELKVVPVNLFLLLLSVFVAYGRFANP